MSLSDQHKADLTTALQLTTDAHALMDKADELLVPVYTQVVKMISDASEANRSEVLAIINQFPRGFYHSEALTQYLLKFGRIA